LAAEPFRLWRQLVGYAAAYAIAFQAAFSGLAIITQAASPDATPAVICSEHPGFAPDTAPQPLGGTSLCPCGAACNMAGSSLPPDAPRIAALGSRVIAPAALSRCGSPALPKHAARAPQIPRAPPAI
jgi:hypothetical protein